MTDDLTPDPFDDELRARLHAAADPIDGTGVRRDGIVAAAAERRRRQTRTRTAVVGVAAAVVLFGGIAVAAQLGDGTPEQVTAGPATTTIAEPPCSLEPTRRIPPVSGPATDGTTAVVAGEVGGDPQTTTTLAGSDGGETPFEAWAAILREKGLLTPEQEASIAAGEGIELTGEQSAALQEYWDEQAAATSTTAPTFAPGPEVPVEAIDPCAGEGESVVTTEPVTTTATVAMVPTAPTTTEAQATTTVAASSVDDSRGAWVVYLYILSGRRNADGSITPALDRMLEIMDGSEPGQMERAQRARDAAGERVIVEADLTCDGPAADSLGLDTDLDHLGISVGFAHQADAQAFADGLPEDLGAFDPVYVPDSCTQPRATS